MTRPLAVLFAVAAAALAAVTFVYDARVRAGPGSGDTGSDVAAGERVFQSSCAMCHGADAAGMMGMHPSLRGAVDRLSSEGLEVTIRKGRSTRPPMPAFENRLTAPEIDDLITYIASLPDGPRNFGPGVESGMMRVDGMMGDGGMGPGGIAMMAVAVLAVAALVVVGVLLARDRTSPHRQLDRRYAAGKLSREEYLRARRDLERH